MVVGSARDSGEHLYFADGTAGSAIMPTQGHQDAKMARVLASFQARLSLHYPQRDCGTGLFSGPEAAYGLDMLPRVANAGIVNLHWVASFLNLAGAAAALRGRPIFWTLHDMRPFTGGCHYSGGCSRFIDRCGSCPQLASDDSFDLSFQAWQRQMGEYRKCNLHIVTPSEWLADRARQSSLLRSFPVHTIENGHPLDVFTPLDRMALRRELGIVPEDFVLGVTAENLREKRKGMQYLFACLERIAASDLRDTVRVFALGANPPDAVARCGVRADAVGHVAGIKEMALYYNVLDAVMLPSLEDNMPNVIAEAMGCGTPVIAFDVGGVGGMVSHSETGWLVPAKDAQGLAEGVRGMYANGFAAQLRENCRQTALARWEMVGQARKYRELFAASLAGSG